MGLEDLWLPHGKSSNLGWEIISPSAQKGLQVGAPSCMLLSPAVWLALRSRSPGLSLYNDVLPRAGSAGLLIGALVGGTFALAAASKADCQELQDCLLDDIPKPRSEPAIYIRQPIQQKRLGGFVHVNGTLWRMYVRMSALACTC